MGEKEEEENNGIMDSKEGNARKSKEREEEREEESQGKVGLKRSGREEK